MLLKLQAGSPLVEIQETNGNPPDQFVILLRCKGITELAIDGRPQYSDEHRLSIVLPSSYPRSIPELRMLSPIWHPNIDATQGWICMGHEGERGYVPSMSLDDLVVRIIRIIRYENYSHEFHLNSDAFQWAQRNTHLFPLENHQIFQEQLDIHILERNVDQDLIDQISLL
jgi:ubiquitin-protein ligase